MPLGRAERQLTRRVAHLSLGALALLALALRVGEGQLVLQLQRRVLLAQTRQHRLHERVGVEPWWHDSGLQCMCTCGLGGWPLRLPAFCRARP